MPSSMLAYIGGNGTPIGGIRLAQESGSSISDVDNSYYLRSGMAIAAAGFPIAAALESCKVSGIASISASTPAVTQVADNGAGTIVACFGHSTNVLVSTDSGANFVHVAHGLAFPACGVVWNGTTFIVCGNSTSTFYTATSVSGTSFSAGSTLATNTLIANTVIGAWNGTVALFVASGTVKTTMTTPNGTSLTSRTLPVSTERPNIVVNGSTFFVAHDGSATAYTTSDGSSSTARTTPAGEPIIEIAFVGGLYLLLISTNIYYTSPDLTVWTKRMLPISINTLDARMTNDGSRAYIGAMFFGISAAVLWTTDALEWKVRWTSKKPSQTAMSVWHCHAGKTLLPAIANGDAVLRIPSWSVADYVGSGQEVASDGGGASGVKSLVGYLRLK